MPVRSNVARRMSVTRSASGAGRSPAASSLANTNASIGLRTHPASFTAGDAGFAIGLNDQNCRHWAQSYESSPGRCDAVGKVEEFATALGAGAYTTIPERVAQSRAKANRVG